MSMQPGEWVTGILNMIIEDNAPADGVIPTLTDILHRPSWFVDILACLICGPVFLTWHHGIEVGLMSIIVTCTANFMWGWLFTVSLWCGIGLFRPVLYLWFRSTADHRIMNVVIITVILTLLTIL